MEKDSNTKDYTYKNPLQKNQHQMRSLDEIQKIINNKPKNWTKKDFRGEGQNNNKKILTRSETERDGLIFKNTAHRKKYKDGKLKCSICKKYKILDDFPNDKYGTTNQKRSNCSECDTIRSKEYYWQNKY